MSSPSLSFASTANSTVHGPLTVGWQLPPPVRVTVGGRFVRSGSGVGVDVGLTTAGGCVAGVRVATAGGSWGWTGVWPHAVRPAAAIRAAWIRRDLSGIIEAPLVWSVGAT